MIEADAELILIDRLVVDAPVVVGGPGAGRQRIALQQRAGDRIHALRRESCCPGTACASRRRRPATVVAGIVDRRHAAADRLGEDALALQQRRHRGDHRAADRLPLALIVDEEERPIAPNRPADDAAELVAAELRLDRGWSRRRSCARSAPRGGRTRRRVPRNALLPDLVVRLTTPPLKRPNSAGGLLLSILNSWIASMFGKNATCPGSGCSTEMPSNRYSLVRGRPPLMRGSGAAGGGGSATPGARLGERDEAAAVERQVDDLPVVDDVAEPGGFAAQQRRVGRHRDGFGHAAELAAADPAAPSRRSRAGCPHGSAAGIRSTPRGCDTCPAARPEWRSRRPSPVTAVRVRAWCPTSVAVRSAPGTDRARLVDQPSRTVRPRRVVRGRTSPRPHSANTQRAPQSPPPSVDHPASSGGNCILHRSG